VRIQTILLAMLAVACVAAPRAAPPTESSAAGLSLERDPEVSRVASEAPHGVYALDPRHTSVVWRVRHWGLSPYTGRFDRSSGQLNFDSTAPERSSVRVSIPLNSISTGLVNSAGERAFDRDIAAYLGGATHPEIVFESQSIEVTSPTTGLIRGVLSFNGQTHPVTLDTMFEGGRTIPTSGRATIAFTARTIIRRSQWLAGTPALHNSASPGDEVEIIVSAEFVRVRE
jgi:polyisoprenoid-binding protein YceI